MCSFVAQISLMCQKKKTRQGRGKKVTKTTMSFLVGIQKAVGDASKAIEDVSISVSRMQSSNKQEVRDDATVATQERSNVNKRDVYVLSQKATQIQAVARGIIIRNRMKNREQYTMSQTRAKAGHTIMKEGSLPSFELVVPKFDIEQNLRSVRELLKSNKISWERCQVSLYGKKADNKHMRSFKRVGFVTIVASTSTKDNKMTFTSVAEESKKSFDMATLEILPGKLGGIFEVKYTKFGFIDYESFLEKALLLHEDVLGPFLAKLDDHLTIVQDILDEVDSWLSEPANDSTFIRNTFNLGDYSKLMMPKTKEEIRLQNTIVLKEYEILDDFQVTGSFNIKFNRDRTMLMKLLEFIST